MHARCIRQAPVDSICLPLLMLLAYHVPGSFFPACFPLFFYFFFFFLLFFSFSLAFFSSFDPVLDPVPLSTKYTHYPHRPACAAESPSYLSNPHEPIQPRIPHCPLRQPIRPTLSTLASPLSSPRFSRIVLFCFSRPANRKCQSWLAAKSLRIISYHPCTP